MSLFEAKPPQTGDRPVPDAMFRLALAGSPMPIAILDGHGAWRYANPAFEQLLGQSPDAPQGASAADLFHPDDRVAFEEAMQAVASGQQVAVESARRCLRSNGGEVWVQATLSAIEDPGRETSSAPSDVLLTLRDLGAERSGQTTLRHHAGDDVQMAEAAQQQLQMFADSVAHDLRAPLRSIESFAGLLEKRCGPQLDDGGRDHLQRIRAAAARMGSLLTGLGDLSTATRSELKPATVDLSMLADWVLAELQDAEPDRVADLEITPDLRVQGDERLLKLMLTHLLGNAWKFSRDRDVVRIQVVGEAREGRLHVQVRDAGSGFDMRYARKLFEPFQRLHGPDAGGGHGLGLAAAHRIAVRHGGTLSGESVPGEGATFHIDLPTACATEESADAQGHPAG